MASATNMARDVPFYAIDHRTEPEPELEYMVKYLHVMLLPLFRFFLFLFRKGHPT